MFCPKCNSELMNINGRYVCINCGSEVAENEALETVGNPVNVADQNVSPESSFSEMVPSDSAPAVVPEVPSGDLMISDLATTPLVDASSTIETSENDTAKVSEQPQMEPLTVPAVAPSNLQNEEKFDEQPVVPTENNDNQPQIEQNIYSTEVEAPTLTETPLSQASADSEVMDVTSPQYDSVSDTPLDSVSEESQVPTEVASQVVPATSEGATASLEQSEPVENAIDVSQPIPQVEENTPVQPESPVAEPVVESEVTESNIPIQQVDSLAQKSDSEMPVDILADGSPDVRVPEVPPAQAFSPDAAIYQDPIFDQAANPDVINSIEHKVKDQTETENQRKKILLFSTFGVALFLLLSIGGYFGYKALTTPAVPAQVTTDTWVDYTDDSSGYSAKFPIQPDKNIEDLTYGGTKLSVAEVKASQDNGQTSYDVNSFSLSQPVTTDKQDETIKGYLTDFAKNVGGEITESNLADESTGRIINFLVTAKDGGGYDKGKIILTDSSVYIIYTSYGTDVPTDYDKFISSFSLNDASEDNTNSNGSTDAGN